MGEASRYVSVGIRPLEDYTFKNGAVRIVKPADPELLKAWHESDAYRHEQKRIADFKKKYSKGKK